MEMEWLSNQQCVIWSCPPGQPKTHLEVKELLVKQGFMLDGHTVRK